MTALVGTTSNLEFGVRIARNVAPVLRPQYQEGAMFANRICKASLPEGGHFLTFSMNFLSFSIFVAFFDTVSPRKVHPPFMQYVRSFDPYVAFLMHGVEFL
jgi:hypothetical protein